MLRVFLQYVVYLFTGSLFGAGLAWSAMINPQKIQDFLNITGPWDPSLLLVMIGAIFGMGLAVYYCKKRQKPVLETCFNLPTRFQIDKKLVIGATLFGMGWGLVGLCPGPALVSLIYLKKESILFLLAMFFGMGVSKILPYKR